MFAAIVMVTGLAWRDERREANAALSDRQSQQSILASSLADGLRAHLTTVERDARLIASSGSTGLDANYDPVVVRSASEPRAVTSDPTRLLLTIPVPGAQSVDLGVSTRDLLGAARSIGTASDLVLLLSPPGDPTLHAPDGHRFSSSAIHDALGRDLSALRLTRDEAAQVGLQERTAMAGLATVDAGALGRWNVVAVASAASERDREKWAVWRLVLSVLVASSLVVVFGGVALRKQRRELDLFHRLNLAEVERERDEHLLRAERVATMGTFAMGVAHEVSTPLGIIVGRAEQLLGRLHDDERAARGAKVILDQSDRIQHIVRRFLEMARGGPLSFARADPSDVIRSATLAVEHRFAKAHVSLTTDIPAVMPPIQCDHDLLEQALVNLLLNACDACTAGGHVEVAARWDSRCVAFVVKDDGVGIGPETAAHATEPFFTAKPDGVGAGLGLAIAAEIAKSHRGELTLSANGDRGTRACIEIPMAGQGDLHG